MSTAVKRRARGVDVEQVVELVLGERRDLGLARRRLRRVLEVGAQLAARHLDHVAVPHAGRDLRFHRQLLAST